MKSNVQVLLIWTVIIAGIIWLLGRQPAPKVIENKISYSEFLRLVHDEKIESVTLMGQGVQEITGKFKPKHMQGKEFTTIGRTDSDQLVKLLHEKGVYENYKEEEKTSYWATALLSWLPILAILFVFIMFMRQLQSGSNKALSFGQSRAKRFNENKSKTRFTDVAGCDEAKYELQEVVEFLKNPKKFTRLGGRIPKGVLLVGEPGTGKTLLAKAVAGEASVPFYSISGSEFVEMFVGVGASRVRSLFDNAKKTAPCLVFIDEIDAVGRHRGAGLGGGHDEREQTLNQLLVEMDGFEGNEGIIIIAATNRVDVLDPALLRPGRFDRRVMVQKPDIKGRVAILKVHTRKIPVADNVDVEIVARGTPGFTGANLENLVNEAALNAAHHDKKQVEMIDFDEAKDKVIMGSARKSLLMSDIEKKHTAYHEAGHAIVAHVLPPNDPVYKVTIIPRGPALGVTMTLPKEDQFSLSAKKSEAMISFMMGGRIAEEIIFGHYTTGASNDIQKATDLARRMVTEWGMSKKLGPINFNHESQNVFLGRDMNKSSHISEQTAQLIDQEVSDIVKRNNERARTILVEHKDKLEAMAEALLKYETIEHEDIKTIMAGKKVVKNITQEVAASENKDNEKKSTSDDPKEPSKVDLNKTVKV